jgi:hypothetical protein
MSDWVVHFTGTEQSLRSILAEGLVWGTGPYGNGRKIHEVRAQHLSACFSEIPLDHLERLYKRRGRWGIGFHKRVIDAAGGGRVWYLEKGTQLQEAVFKIFGDMLREQDFNHLIWSLSPFIDVMSDDYNYRFDWEREWTVPRGLHFEPSDVAFLLLPDGIDAVRASFSLDVGVPTFVANGPTGLATVPEELGDERDHLIATFAESFLEPIEHLLYDPEDSTGFSWPVRSWATEDAVDEIFPVLRQEDRDFVINELNNLSTEWIKHSEWIRLGE